jgi:cystathionine beta-lyase/cystathionine gamma-synthase
MRLSTRLVHVGQEPSGPYGGVIPPIHLASTYDQQVQDQPAYFYGRGENPTREGLESCLASIEGARYATVLSSGQAAGATVLSLLRPGDRIVVSDDVYGGTYQLLALAEQHGVGVSYADLTDLDTAQSLIRGDVKMVWAETPTNPQLKICDIRALARLAGLHGALLVVDNTFAGPILQQPLAFGADVSLYSTTKSIAGHSDTIGGALVYNGQQLHLQMRSYRSVAGNIPGPLDCFLVHRGIKTMAVRVAHQAASAERIASALLDVPNVKAVHYPGLSGHPQHELARQQMSRPGSIITFDYDGDVSLLLKRMRLWRVAVSLGSVCSLIEWPAGMTHRPIPLRERTARGITEGLVRLSVGIEDPFDLLEDLMQALR